MTIEALNVTAKLTKAFYMGLPDAVFLVCSAGMSPLEPSFAEYVVPTAQRVEQWKRIKDARVDQLQCDVYQNKDAFDDFLKGWRRRPDGAWVHG